MSTTSLTLDRLRFKPRPEDFLNRNAGAVGEVFFNRDTGSLRVYNGQQSGGFEIAKADLSNVDSSILIEKIQGADLPIGTLGDFIFSEATIDTVDNVKITITPDIEFDNNLIINSQIQFSDGTNTSSANIDASKITSGILNINRFGDSGTRDSTTFLRGDNTWAVISLDNNSFETISIAGQNNITAATPASVLNLIAGSNILLTANAQTNAITISSTAEVIDPTNSFSIISIPEQDDIEATSATSTLNLIGGTNISLTTDSATNTITFSNDIINERQLVSVSTGTIENNATADADITGYRGYVLYKIQTSAPAWIRLYASTAARTADVNRSQDQDPLPGSGVIAEAIITGNDLINNGSYVASNYVADGYTDELSVLIAPGVFGFNSESPITNNIPIAVTNLSGESQDITVTLTVINANFTLGVQETFTQSTGTISDSASVNLNITGYRGYILQKLQTSDAAWIRLYTSDAARIIDQNRSQGQEPILSAGVITEIITTGSETVLIAPGIFGFNNELPTTSNIPITVTNLSGDNANITVALTAIGLEV